MATAEQLVNAGGEVKIGRFAFLVKELPFAAEVRLRNRLGAMARDALGPGQFYHNTLPVAKWLSNSGHAAEAADLLSTTANLVATRATLSGAAIDEFAQSPDGIVEELWWRTRDTHPDTSRDEFRAIVNDANAVEIAIAIVKALDPKKDTTPATPPSGS